MKLAHTCKVYIAKLYLIYFIIRGSICNVVKTFKCQGSGVANFAVSTRCHWRLKAVLRNKADAERKMFWLPCAKDL